MDVSNSVSSGYNGCGCYNISMPSKLLDVASQDTRGKSLCVRQTDRQCGPPFTDKLILGLDKLRLSNSP